MTKDQSSTGCPINGMSVPAWLPDLPDWGLPSWSGWRVAPRPASPPSARFSSTCLAHFWRFWGTKNGSWGAWIKILRPLFNTNTPLKPPFRHFRNHFGPQKSDFWPFYFLVIFPLKFPWVLFHHNFFQSEQIATFWGNNCDDLCDN